MAESYIVLTERSYISVFLALRQQSQYSKEYAKFIYSDVFFSSLGFF